MDIFGHPIPPDALAAQIGSPAQVAGIRQIRLDDGPQKGGRLIQIHNAAGLRVELLPDRCLDIGQVWLNGVPFAWMGPWGLPSKGAGISMDNALGGLMATCGFDHIRQPERQDGHDYPLHGTMALTPCETVELRPAPAPGDDFIVEATTRAQAPDGAEYTLMRRVTVPFGRAEIRLEDRIITTPASPVFALYHINLGFPLIGAGTRVTLNGASLNDRLAPEPQVQIGAAPAGAYTVGVSNAVAGLEVACDGADLAWLQTYRRADAGMNLFSIEPVTHDRKPRAELLKDHSTPPPALRNIGLRFSFQTPGTDPRGGFRADPVQARQRP